jgi:hypothetical protein
MAIKQLASFLHDSPANMPNIFLPFNIWFKFASFLGLPSGLAFKLFSLGLCPINATNLQSKTN